MIAHRLTRVIFTALVLVASMFFLVSPVAAEQCQCVCAATGGTQPGKVTTQDQAGAECPTSCAQYPGGRYISCVESISQIDAGGTLCWKQDECQNRMVNIDGQDRPSVWGGTQPTDCPAGSHRCYNPPQPVNLNVSIDTLSNPKQASGIDEYIVALYDLLIPAAALIAVVFIMIGGLQYVLARGDGGRITKAKERISKAVTGLVLLLLAYTIATLVDPRLTSFEALKVPVHKSAIFVEGDACEDLIAQIRAVYCEERSESDCLALINSVIEQVPPPAGVESGDCGSKCIVKEMPDGVFLAGVEAGAERFYSDCAHVGADAGCFHSPDGSYAECLRCWDINPKHPFGIPASNQTCGRLDPVSNGAIKPNADGDYDVYARCFMAIDSDVNPSVTDIGSSVSTAISGGYCGVFSLGCDEVTSCSDYGEVLVGTGPPPNTDGGIVGAFVTGIRYLFGQQGSYGRMKDVDIGPYTYRNLCLEDPCGLGCGWTSNTCAGTGQGSSAGRRF